MRTRLAVQLQLLCCLYWAHSTSEKSHPGQEVLDGHEGPTEEPQAEGG